MTAPFEPSLQKDISATFSVLVSQDTGLPAALVTWADGYLRSLSELGAEFEILELLRAGCKKTPLAATLKCGTFLAKLPATYYDAFGDSKRLAQLSAQLEATALLFDGLATKLPSTVPTDLVFGTAPGPQQMAAHLRTYQSLASFVPLLIEFTNIRSVRDVERHLPTAYVKKVTGEWHDREVAVLIGAATGVELDEGAHRVWRNRNFSEIALPFGALWDIIAMLSETHNSKP